MKKIFLMIPSLLMLGACASADPGADVATGEQELGIDCSVVLCAGDKVCEMQGTPARPVCVEPGILPIPPKLCELPIDKGYCSSPQGSHCPSRVRRFGFDQASGECRMFVYEGRGGNANNFRRLEDCQAKCDPPPPVNACEQKIDPGPCRANLPRWGFDQESGECTKFVYGGCLGNSNNFPTQEACEAKCEPRIPEDRCGALLCPPNQVCADDSVVCVRAPCCVPKGPPFETPHL